MSLERSQESLIVGSVEEPEEARDVDVRKSKRSQSRGARCRARVRGSVASGVDKDGID